MYLSLYQELFRNYSVIYFLSKLMKYIASSFANNVVHQLSGTTWPGMTQLKNQLIWWEGISYQSDIIYDSSIWGIY